MSYGSYSQKVHTHAYTPLYFHKHEHQSTELSKETVTLWTHGELRTYTYTQHNTTQSHHSLNSWLLSLKTKSSTEDNKKKKNSTEPLQTKNLEIDHLIGFWNRAEWLNRKWLRTCQWILCTTISVWWYEVQSITESTISISAYKYYKTWTKVLCNPVSVTRSGRSIPP